MHSDRIFRNESHVFEIMVAISDRLCVFKVIHIPQRTVKDRRKREREKSDGEREYVRGEGKMGRGSGK